MPASRQGIDRLFYRFFWLEVVSMLILPLGPVIVSAVATATSVRRSGRYLAILWGMGVLLSLPWFLATTILVLTNQLFVPA